MRYRTGVVTYSTDDLYQEPSCWSNYKNHLSTFDKLLIEKWESCVKNGLCRYDLNDCKYKVLECEDQKSSFKGVAIYNVQRRTNRRKACTFETMNEAFSHEKFNFNQVKDEEVMFYLNPVNKSQSIESNSNNNGSQLGNSMRKHALLVNVSPNDYCSCLLVPDVKSCHPQQINAESLLVAFDLVQLSNHPGFYVGFNGINAWASVNHLHFHCCYTDYELYLADTPYSRKISDLCFLIDDKSPVSGFVFPVSSDVGKRRLTASSIEKVVKILISIETPYNIAICKSSKGLGTRCFLWPRKSTKHMNADFPIRLGSSEMTGHCIVTSEEYLDSLSGSKASNIIKESSLKESEFLIVKEKVSQVLTGVF